MNDVKKKRKRPFDGFTWDFVLRDKFGRVKERWQQDNALADEGEEDMLDVYFRNATAPTTFYVRLYNDTPAETDGLGDLVNEASGNGYSAQELERTSTGFPTLALDSGDYQLTSKTVTFTASGGAIPASGSVTYAVLATTSNDTGKLVAYVALSQSRSLADGESLQVTLNIKLQ